MFNTIALVVPALRRRLPAEAQRLHGLGEAPVVGETAAEGCGVHAAPVPCVQFGLEVGVEVAGGRGRGACVF